MNLDSLTWRKSSYSNGSGGACVEVAELDGGGWAVRDSKEPEGAVLRFSQSEWAGFVVGIRGGEFEQRLVQP